MYILSSPSRGFYSSDFLAQLWVLLAQDLFTADSLWQQMIRILNIDPTFTFASPQTSLYQAVPVILGKSVHTILLSPWLPTELNTNSHFFFTSACNATNESTPTLFFPDASCILVTLLLGVWVFSWTILLPGIFFPYPVTCLMPINTLGLSLNITSETFLEPLNNTFITLVPSHALILSEHNSPSFTGLNEFTVTHCVDHNVSFTRL